MFPISPTPFSSSLMRCSCPWYGSQLVLGALRSPLAEFGFTSAPRILGRRDRLVGGGRFVLLEGISFYFDPLKRRQDIPFLFLCFMAYFLVHSVLSFQVLTPSHGSTFTHLTIHFIVHLLRISLSWPYRLSSVLHLLYCASASPLVQVQSTFILASIFTQQRPCLFPDTVVSVV